MKRVVFQWTTSLPNLYFSRVSLHKTWPVFKSLHLWLDSLANQKGPRGSWIRAEIPVLPLVHKLWGGFSMNIYGGPYVWSIELLVVREIAGCMLQIYLPFAPHRHGCLGSFSESRRVQVVVRGRGLWVRMIQDVFAGRLLGIKALLMSLLFFFYYYYYAYSRVSNIESKS